MARQEQLEEIIGATNRIAFYDFSGVTKFGFIWVSHFTKAEEGKKAGEEFCEE